MSDPERPKPSDEGAVTRRWSPGSNLKESDPLEQTMARPATDLNATVLAKPVPPPAPTPEPSRRLTLTMSAVNPAAAHNPAARAEPAPESTRMPASPETLPPPTVLTHVDPDPVHQQAGAGVELIVVEEKQVSGTEKRAWRAAEVWTKRRVYGLDSTFKCVEILDRETGLPEQGHEMLGARLGGGRHRDKDKVRFSYPLPLPGMEAMFMKAKKHGYTSPVERMIVRVRVLVTSADEALPSWDEISSRWSEPPPK